MKNQRTVHKSVRKSTIKRDTPMDRTLKSSFIGILATVGIGLALMFASTAAALLTDDPTAFVNPIGYVTIFITSFLGGFICSKVGKHSPYLVAILCGADFIILSMLSSLMLPNSFASNINFNVRLIIYVISFLLFPLGALAGIKASKPQRAKRKKR